MDSSWKVLKSCSETKEYLDYLKHCWPDWSGDRVYLTVVELRKVPDYHLSLCFNEEDISAVRNHCYYTRHYPWYRNPGTLDTLRSGCHNNPVVYSVVDDQLYDWGKNCKMEDENLRKQALVYTVRASDIFYSVARAEMQLWRDKKDRPYGLIIKLPTAWEMPWRLMEDSIAALVHSYSMTGTPLLTTFSMLKLPTLTMKTEIVHVNNYISHSLVYISLLKGPLSGANCFNHKFNIIFPKKFLLFNVKVIYPCFWPQLKEGCQQWDWPWVRRSINSPIRKTRLRLNSRIHSCV